MPFNSETARLAGMKSKRGRNKMTPSNREFIFKLLQENRDKMRYMMGELTPQKFCDVYLRLLPYITAPKQLQKIEMDDISKDEIKDLVRDVLKSD